METLLGKLLAIQLLSIHNQATGKRRLGPARRDALAANASAWVFLQCRSRCSCRKDRRSPGCGKSKKIAILCGMPTALPYRRTSPNANPPADPRLPRAFDPLFCSTNANPSAPGPSPPCSVSWNWKLLTKPPLIICFIVTATLRSLLYANQILAYGKRFATMVRVVVR
jgi:hypothetical protein